LGPKRRAPSWLRARWALAHAHIAALRINALTEPCIVEGPINGTIFRGYIEQFLVPTLKPGDIVILDNLGSHRSQAIRSAILGAGAKLAFLPPPAFAGAGSTRPTSTPSNRSSQRSNTGCGWLKPAPSTPSTSASPNLVTGISQAECASYIRNAGYASG